MNGISGDYNQKKAFLLHKMEEMVKKSGEKGIDIDLLVYNLQKIYAMSQRFFMDEIERRVRLGIFIMDNPMVKWQDGKKESDDI